MKLQVFPCDEIAIISASIPFSLYGSVSGEAYSWGMGSNMQLGMGDDDSDLWIPTKIKAKALENKPVKAVSAGGQHTVLLASDISAKPSTASKSPVTNGIDPSSAKDSVGASKESLTTKDSVDASKEPSTSKDSVDASKDHNKSEDESMDASDN